MTIALLQFEVQINSVMTEFIWTENRKTAAFFLWATCALHGIAQILWNLGNFVIVMSIVVLIPNRWLLKPRMVSLSYSSKMPEEAPPACLILGEQANLQRISFSDVESLISHRVSAKVSSLLILILSSIVKVSYWPLTAQNVEDECMATKLMFIIFN